MWIRSRTFARICWPSERVRTSLINLQIQNLFVCPGTWKASPVHYRSFQNRVGLFTNLTIASALSENDLGHLWHTLAIIPVNSPLIRQSCICGASKFYAWWWPDFPAPFARDKPKFALGLSGVNLNRAFPCLFRYLIKERKLLDPGSLTVFTNFPEDAALITLYLSLLKFFFQHKEEPYNTYWSGARKIN